MAYCKFLFAFVIYKFADYPDEVKVAAMISALCVMIIVVMILVLFVMSWKNKRTQRLRDRIEKKYGKGMEYIVSQEASELLSEEDIERAFGFDRSELDGPLLKNNREKHMFVEIFYLYFISKRSELSKTENSHTMLRMFDIPDYLEKEISLGSMKHKANALSKMRTFKLPISPWVINKLLNSKYMRVQRLAMYSNVMSSSDSALDYFETDFFDKNCCIKDEIELGFSLQRRRKMGLKLPNLARWAHIQSNEKTQCMFVRLMRRFNEIEYCGELKDLYNDSKKKKLIEEISRTWGYLRYIESEELLKKALLTQPDDTKVAIMHALTRLATGNSLDALLDGFKNTTNPHVRYEALRCIYNYGPEGRALFQELEKNSTDADKKYFDFFNNPITLEKIRLDKEQAYHPSVETVFNG
ncbi:MAG: HEAT repeat domain-containing protein [Bacteroidaceae bacterium]|nr:HEAT repeat domain-containing protein [Bacteroidaceae bacterium]